MSLHAAAVLAASDKGKGSPIGLFVVLLLVIAVYLLYRSMTGHLRRLPEKFPGYGGTDAAAADTPEGTAAAGTPAGTADAAGTAGISGPAPEARTDGDPVRPATGPEPPADH
ncbi:MAG TPA: hypothetical protein VGX49_02565 [Jatrophihabitans sp.]|nr:hypothetical protein [Jatrophihabitans sp.]